MDVFDEVDISIIFDLVCREIEVLDNYKKDSTKSALYDNRKVENIPLNKDPQKEFDLRTLYRKLQVLDIKNRVRR